MKSNLIRLIVVTHFVLFGLSQKVLAMGRYHSPAAPASWVVPAHVLAAEQADPRNVVIAQLLDQPHAANNSQMPVHLQPQAHVPVAAPHTNASELLARTQNIL